jgi:hypothetical protein
MVTSLLARKCKQGYGGIWRSLKLSGIWSLKSDGRLCVAVFGRNLALVALKMLPHLMSFMKKLYNFCTSYTICKGNSAINYIIVKMSSHTWKDHKTNAEIAK